MEGRGCRSMPHPWHAASRLDTELSLPGHWGASPGEPPSLLVLRDGQTTIYQETLCKGVPAFPEADDGGEPCSPHAEGMSLVPRGDPGGGERTLCRVSSANQPHVGQLLMPSPTGLMQLMNRGQAFNTFHLQAPHL